MDKYEAAENSIKMAKKELEKGDYGSIHLANYILRDLEITKEANLYDLSWALHQGNSSKNDVLGLIEYIERYLKDIEKGEHNE